ncbi:MAG: MFS transporter [Anaerolineaceae bacterium]|nr:MFS transporter [Anaerolineaceae bacterium]
MKRNNRYTLTILFLTLFMTMVGFGVIMPILPYYAENLGASATELGLLSATYATLQFFFAPVWGRVSDKVGRKPILLLGLFGFSVSFVIFGLSTRLWMLFAARAVSGIISAATLPTVMAYIADSTDEKERAGGMSTLGAAMGLGMIFGPVIGGFLGEYNPSTPFFFSAAVALGVAVFGLIFLPETLSEEARQAAMQSRKAGGGIAGIFIALRGPLAYLMLLALLVSFGMSQMESTAALFYERKFGAGEAEMGIIFMVMGVVSAGSQGVFVGRVINRWGEQRAIMAGLLGTALSFLIFPLIFSVTSAIGVIIIMGVVTSFLRPALNSLISKRTNFSEQGMILGVVNSYFSLGRMFGPVTGGLIFDYLGLDWPYLVASFIHFLAFGLSFIFLAVKAPQKPLLVVNTPAE